MTSLRTRLAALAAVLALALGGAVPTASGEPRDTLVVPTPCTRTLGQGVIFGTVGCGGTVSAQVAGSPAVSAVCVPLDLVTCSGSRTVDVEVSGFGAAETVHLWFASGEQDAQNDSSCAQLSGRLLGRAHLGDVRTGSSGAGRITRVLLPPPGVWSYGTNWICATLASHSGVAAAFQGGQLFTIYPA